MRVARAKDYEGHLDPSTYDMAVEASSDTETEESYQEYLQVTRDLMKGDEDAGAQ